eukprot:901745_1
MGLQNGQISIRDKSGNEKVSIERSEPIWCLSWNPNRDDGSDVLAVGCWDKTLSFYQLSGKQIGKDKDLGFDPCCIQFFNWTGECLLLGGSDRSFSLWSRHGVLLKKMAQHDGWVWTVTQLPGQSVIGEVYCVVDSRGGSNSAIFIRKKDGEGVLKYRHSDAMQALAYNPVT